MFSKCTLDSEISQRWLNYGSLGYVFEDNSYENTSFPHSAHMKDFVDCIKVFHGQ